jgi:hypothetical protein
VIDPEPEPQALPATDRRRLVNRRLHEAREIVFGGIRYHVGLGRFPDGQLAAEVGGSE